MGWSCSGWPVEEVALSEIVMVEVPEGVTRGAGGVVMDALPPPQPTRTNGMQKSATERTPQSARRFLQTAGGSTRAFLLTKENDKKRRASKICVGSGMRERGGMRSGKDGGNWAGPLVVTVTANVAGPLASETLAGTWQTAPKGAPLQLSETVPVKPAPGVS